MSKLIMFGRLFVRKSYFSYSLFVFFILLLQIQVVNAQNYTEELRTESDGFKWTWCSTNGSIVGTKIGAKINGKQVVDCKYEKIIYRDGYFFAYNKHIEKKESWGTSWYYHEVSADVYSVDGVILYHESDGMKDCRRVKELNTTLFQNTSSNWYDLNTGRFVYWGGRNSNNQYMGDSFGVSSVGHGYAVSYVYPYSSCCMENAKKIDIYALGGRYLGAIDNQGFAWCQAAQFNKLGVFFNFNTSASRSYSMKKSVWYDEQLKETKVKTIGYGTGYFIIVYQTKDGQEYSYVYDVYDNDTVYLPQFDNKQIIQAQGFSDIDFTMVKLDDNKCYDKNGKFLFNWTKKDLPSKNDLFVDESGKKYIRTHEGKLQGVSTLEGKEILAPEFTKVEMIGKNFLYEMNGYQGVMTPAGKQLIPLSRHYTKITYSRTFKTYSFEKEGGYKGECNASGVQTSIAKVAQPTAPNQPATAKANNNQQQQQPANNSTQSNQPAQNQGTVKVPITIACSGCSGTLKCIWCKGQGYTWSGDTKHRCGICNGTGICQDCHGTGVSAVVY